MTADSFRLFERDGLWGWDLRVANQPTAHPIARCGTACKTELSARNSMDAARRAIMGAFKDGEPRVERVPPPR